MKKKVIAIMGAALLLLSACGGQSGKSDACLLYTSRCV